MDSVVKEVEKHSCDTTNNIALQLVLVAYIIFIKRIPITFLIYFNNFYVRLVVAGLIAFMLFKNIITALMLALAFIMTLKELKNRNTSRYSEPVLPNLKANDLIHTNVIQLKDQLPQDTSNEDILHPAFKTMTQNLVENPFTTDKQFMDVQSNMVQGVDPDMGVKTLTHQHGAQGLDIPLGYDTQAPTTSVF
jgi:hypothetical protein